MAQSLVPSELSRLYEVSRRGDIADSLATYGEIVTGTRGYLVSNSLVIHPTDSELPLVGNGCTFGISECSQRYFDRVLAHASLSISQFCIPERDPFCVSVCAIALRLGLLSRMLDMAYEHLKDRTSFGQKTVKHQLVRATFSELQGLVLRLNLQAHIRVEKGLETGLINDHREILDADSRAEKLMGGHGYLIGGTHGLSYLSALIFSIYGTHEQ